MACDRTDLVPDRSPIRARRRGRRGSRPYCSADSPTITFSPCRSAASSNRIGGMVWGIRTQFIPASAMRKKSRSTVRASWYSSPVQVGLERAVGHTLDVQLLVADPQELAPTLGPLVSAARGPTGAQAGSGRHFAFRRAPWRKGFRDPWYPQGRWPSLARAGTRGRGCTRRGVYHPAPEPQVHTAVAMASRRRIPAAQAPRPRSWFLPPLV